MINLFSFSFIYAEKGRRFHCRSYAVFAISVDMLSPLPARRLMPHTFCEAAPEGRLGVRQLAAAFAFSLASFCRKTPDFGEMGALVRV
jgi:hypothetical protein